jgi:SAM-dependent methyltransferase
MANKRWRLSETRRRWPPHARILYFLSHRRSTLPGRSTAERISIAKSKPWWPTTKWLCPGQQRNGPAVQHWPRKAPMNSEEVIGSWSSADYVRDWDNADGLADMLELPWAIASALVGRERAPRLVIDVGSGPGRFLSTVLSAYPDARGVWIDSSQAMRDRARENMVHLGDRVQYYVEDAACLLDVEAARGADVVLNSRVAHHFDRRGLESFYWSAAAVLQPHGWLVTLDHIRPPGDWDRRYRDILPSFAGPHAGQPTHPHKYPFPTMDTHLRAMSAVGLTDNDVAWRTFYTCLMLGRRPPQGALG